MKIQKTDNLINDTVLTPAIKAYLLKERFDHMLLSLKWWSNSLILDTVCSPHSRTAREFREIDITHLNIILSEYALYTGGEI